MFLAIKKFFVGLFNKLVRLFKRFINEAIPLAEQIIIAQFKDLAISIVSKLDKQHLSNADKREKAFNEIKEEIIKKGIKIGDSLIYTLVELAVRYLKNSVNKK